MTLAISSAQATEAVTYCIETIAKRDHDQFDGASCSNQIQNEALRIKKYTLE